MTPDGEICTRNVNSDSIGSACYLCGHYGAVHPFNGNPGLDHCLLCELEAVIAEARRA
jgi:hypothetical protein